MARAGSSTTQATLQKLQSRIEQLETERAAKPAAAPPPR